LQRLLRSGPKICGAVMVHVIFAKIVVVGFEDTKICDTIVVHVIFAKIVAVRSQGHQNLRHHCSSRDICKDWRGWAQGHQNLRHHCSPHDLCKDCRGRVSRAKDTKICDTIVVHVIFAMISAAGSKNTKFCDMIVYLRDPCQVWCLKGQMTNYSHSCGPSTTDLFSQFPVRHDLFPVWHLYLVSVGVKHFGVC
jgi:hypothetical protein